MKVEGIVLAAGYSKRTGLFKMGLKLKDKTIIQQTIDGMSKCCSRVIVVGGYRIERLKKLIGNDKNVQVVFNPDYKKGMFTSVKQGIKHINCEKFFVLPGDIPFVTENVYKKLLKACGDIIIPVYKGRKGHPVLINSTLKNELLEEKDDSSLSRFIKRKGYETVETNEKGILKDIDTLEDYRREKNNLLRGGSNES